MKPNKRKPRESMINLLGGKKNCIAMAIFAAVVLSSIAIHTAMEAKHQRDAQYIASWPITVNRYIELNYAGKGGF